MLKEQFTFFHRDSPKDVYTAVLDGDGVNISWDLENDKGSMIYGTEETEKFIKYGTWVVVE